jgi:hypothetical protein
MNIGARLISFYFLINETRMSELPNGSINNNRQLFCGVIGKEGFNSTISRRQSLSGVDYDKD